MSKTRTTTDSSVMNVVEGCLILTIPKDIDDSVISGIKEDLLKRISDNKVAGVIIDFGSLNIIDSFEFSEFTGLMRMAKLLGVESAIVGLQPGLVSALVDMNIDTGDLNTFLNIEQGLEFLHNKQNAQNLDGPDVDEEPAPEDDLLKDEHTDL